MSQEPRIKQGIQFVQTDQINGEFASSAKTTQRPSYGPHSELFSSWS
jgi:hypothetical protein